MSFKFLICIFYHLSASVEDAKRAVESKNNLVMGGRKIRVALATHRLPREKRKETRNQPLETQKICKHDNFIHFK